MCRTSDKVMPRIGAARSLRPRRHVGDRSASILEAPPRTYDCTTEQLLLRGWRRRLQRPARPADRRTSISFTRCTFAIALGAGRRRGAPRVGRSRRSQRKDCVWRNGAWLPAAALGASDAAALVLPRGHANLPHDRVVARRRHRGGCVLGTFGPLEYTPVALRDAAEPRKRRRLRHQEGIYISYAPSLDDPALWSNPTKILNGGQWYPQVLGLEDGLGTDKMAGEWARFYMLGSSHHFIRFIR